MSESLAGVYAAVLTPRDAHGEIDEAAFAGLLQFLQQKGVAGVAINGATGEFPRTTAPEFSRLMSIAASTLTGGTRILAGIGAPSTDTSIRLATIAAQAGAAAALLPMPAFFPYSQDDLKSFCLAVAQPAALPILLYNLPQFTTGLAPQTSAELIHAGNAIIGIKDSSGSLDTLRLLTSAAKPARRFIGNDEVLPQALRERILDGVVSGVACVLPELILRLYTLGASDPTSADFNQAASILADAIVQLRKLPTPWALKMLAEARGLAPATFPMPLSPQRQTERTALLSWFQANRARLLAE